jgi:hypothetical protein
MFVCDFTVHVNVSVSAISAGMLRISLIDLKSKIIVMVGLVAYHYQEEAKRSD